jgi:cation transport regulator ChaB
LLWPTWQPGQAAPPEAGLPEEADLPDVDLSDLPVAAKDIWVSAYNTALISGEDPDDAVQLAWDAVKLLYRKSGGRWVLKA